ncbi:PRA1 family protein D-like [Curcuma longa]|uniref:PRA1 family protein D-like n=1 Tax=Curcuma longa TaxID=136217 RepID=UPI003D9ED941
MASYGGLLRRFASVVQRAIECVRYARKALVGFARPQAFALPVDDEAAAVRAVRNLRSFRFHYAFLLWILVLASLFSRHRPTMLFLMAASKLALFFGAFLKVFPNSTLLRRIVDRRVMSAFLVFVIGAEIVATGAVLQFLLAMAVGVPLVLLHAVFRVRDDLATDVVETAAVANGGEFRQMAEKEKKEDLELGSQP